MLTMIYAFNATLLVLHELESAYEREWEILRLPGKITGFILMHVPILFILLYGMIEIDKMTSLGLVLGAVTGLGGILPLLVHKILVRREDRFNRILSSLLIYCNAFTGIVLLATVVGQLN